MSIVFDAAADRLKITASPITWDNDITEMGWFYINALTGALQTFMTPLRDDVSGYIFVGTLSGGQLYLETSPGTSITGSPLSTGTWYHVAYTWKAGVGCELFLDGTSIGTASAPSIGGTPATQMERGGWRTTNGNRLDGRTGANKSWQGRILTSTEINAEKNFAVAQSPTSLYGQWYLQTASDLADYSGNGNNWSALGVLTSADDPPGVTFPSAGISIPVVMHHLQEQGFN